jgi:hypothetical protein
VNKIFKKKKEILLCLNWIIKKNLKTINDRRDLYSKVRE